jgi:hypothetical protein
VVVSVINFEDECNCDDVEGCNVGVSDTVFVAIDPVITIIDVSDDIVCFDSVDTIVVVKDSVEDIAAVGDSFVINVDGEPVVVLVVVVVADNTVTDAETEGVNELESVCAWDDLVEGSTDELF